MLLEIINLGKISHVHFIILSLSFFHLTTYLKDVFTKLNMKYCKYKRLCKKCFLNIEMSCIKKFLLMSSFYSGLVILCKGPDSKKKLDHALKQSAAQKSQVLSYL